MYKFGNFIDKVEENKERIETGKFNCIPLPFKRLRRFIPGIIRARNVIFTANSGVGKTQGAKFIYVYHAFLWCKENGVPLKIFYFALEESKEEFIANAVSFFLKDQFDFNVDKDTILSMREKPVSETIIEHIKKIAPLMEEFLEVVDVQDTISNPTGIFMYLKEYALNNGIVHRKNIVIDGKNVEVKDYYEQNDPEEYRIAITDHVSLLQPEDGMTLHQTIGKHSATYGRKELSKFYLYTVVNVQQQSAASEAKEYNNRGELNYSKLEPSLSDLGDNKLTQRDAHLVWGLFAPDRYEIPSYRNWNIFYLNDNYRALMVLKNRDGSSNVRTSLYFAGECNYFHELPKNEKGVIGNFDASTWYDKYSQDKEFWLKENQNLFGADL